MKPLLACLTAQHQQSVIEATASDKQRAEQVRGSGLDGVPSSQSPFSPTTNPTQQASRATVSQTPIPRQSTHVPAESSRWQLEQHYLDSPLEDQPHGDVPLLSPKHLQVLHVDRYVRTLPRLPRTETHAHKRARGEKQSKHSDLIWSFGKLAASDVEWGHWQTENTQRQIGWA